MSFAMSDDENNQKINDDRPERLKLIEKLIQGTSYNNAAAREAIFMVVIQGSDKLQSTMQILAEMAQHLKTVQQRKLVPTIQHNYSPKKQLQVTNNQQVPTDKYQID